MKITKWYIILTFMERFCYLSSFNPFQANFPLPYALKTSEKLQFSLDSRGYRDGTSKEWNKIMKIMKWHIIINFIERFCYLLSFNPFQVNVPLPYPLKTSEKLPFSYNFRGYRSGTLIENGLTISFLRFYEHIPLNWEHVVQAALREKWYRRAQRILPLWHR